MTPPAVRDSPCPKAPQGETPRVTAPGPQKLSRELRASARAHPSVCAPKPALNPDGEHRRPSPRACTPSGPRARELRSCVRGRQGPPANGVNCLLLKVVTDNPPPGRQVWGDCHLEGRPELPEAGAVVQPLVWDKDVR